MKVGFFVVLQGIIKAKRIDGKLMPMTNYYNYVLINRLLHFVRNDGAPFIAWGEMQAAGCICSSNWEG
jgi:hypothetical protein